MNELKNKYDLLVAELNSKEVPCVVNLGKTIVIETGNNSPESLDDAIHDAICKIGLAYNKEVEVCGECCGYEFSESQRTNGRVKNFL